MRTRRIHLVNPKTDSITTRPLYLNRALYSPLAGLLAVAASIPADRYEVVLTDENIETVDFDLKADLVGISARQLEYWVLIGVVAPKLERHGAKVFKKFSRKDLELLQQVKGLTDEGVLVSRAADKVRQP